MMTFSIIFSFNRMGYLYPKSLPLTAQQTGTCNKKTMNRINAKDKFVNDDQVDI